MNTVEEIKRHLTTGDYLKVAAMTGISHDNVRQTLKRPNARRFKAVFNAAKKIAQFNAGMGL